MINRTTTLNLKGLAIILVIFGHLVTSQVLKIPAEFRYFATFSVSVFLILSGYGLTKSYLSNGLKKYTSKRLKSVYIPFFVANIIIYILWGYKSHNISTLIKTISFNQFDLAMDGTMWYIYFIAMWYVLFFFIFSMKITNKAKTTILFIIAGILTQIPTIKEITTISFQFSLHALSFPIGVMLALQTKYDENKIITIISLSFSTFLVFYSLLWEKYSFAKYSITVLAFGIAIILIFKTFDIDNKILSFFGKYSYEAYLVEGMLFWRHFSDNNIIRVCLVYFTIFLCAFLLHHITRLIISIITKSLPAPKSS
ncbi:MAG: acyltransferase family protein [Vibrio sp.]